MAKMSYAAAIDPEDVLTMVAHELRAPLQAIAGWARLLDEGLLSPAQVRAAVAAIRRGAASQRRLVEDLVDGALLRQGAFRIERRPVELRAVIGAAVATLQPSAAEARVRVDTALPARPVRVLGDAHRLEQAFCNLLGNAVKHSPANAPIEVRVEEADGLAVTRVRDHGSGIRREFLPHVFERYRGDGGRRGLGLGLAITRDIIVAHRGAIAADSDGPGRGATFTVTLPIEEDGTTARVAR